MSRNGANWDSSRATGRMISSLLRSDPLAMRQMIDSSRSGLSPCTYRGVTAVSSTTTPAAFTLARPVAPAMSSRDDAVSFTSAATSSSSANSPLMVPIVTSRWP